LQEGKERSDWQSAFGISKRSASGAAILPKAK
jgi:hypothetical protein